MIRYAITAPLPGALDEEATARLAGLAARWAAGGVDYVQLRQKQMSAGDLTALARRMTGAMGLGTRLLINHRADVALASGAAGVHLTSHPGELTPADVRQLYGQAGAPEPVVSVSCHTLTDVERARDLGASLALFGPVFEKPVAASDALPGVGLAVLREACRIAGPLRILALGGITAANAPACMEAGAAGIAGIRLFDC
jgi:thiamine-phosphate pyrophosphorylase